MATKKKKKVVKKAVKKTVKKASPKRTSKAKKSLYGFDRDFLIISGGGLIVIVLTAFMLFG